MWLTRLSDLLVLYNLWFWIAGRSILSLFHLPFPVSNLFHGSAILLATVLLIRWRTHKDMKGDFRHFGLFGVLLRKTESLLTARRGPKAAFVVLIAIFGSLAVAHILRFWSMNVHMWDVVSTLQGLFHPWGKPLLHCDACLGGTALGEHLAFSLFLLTPLTTLFPSVELISALQALIVAAPLWYILKQGPLRAKPQSWLPALIILLCLRPLRAAAVWDFREDLLAYLGFFLAIAALFKARLAWYWPALLLALASKENMFAVGLFLPVPILLSRELKLNRRHRYAMAAGTFALSLAYGIVAFKWWIPLFTGGAESQHPILSRYSAYGSTPWQILKTLAFQPSVWPEFIGQQLGSKAARNYLLCLFAPIALFLNRREAWVWLAPALPGLLMNLTASTDNQRSMTFHYDLLLLPFWITAALLGMSKVTSGKMWALAFFMAISVSGQWPGAHFQGNWPSRDSIEAVKFLRSIPNEGRVAANPWLMAHLIHLPELATLNLPWGTSVPTNSAKIWKELENLNDPAKPVRAGSTTFLQASAVVLDRTQPWEAAIEKLLLAKGFRPRDASERGRIVWLKKSEP